MRHLGDSEKSAKNCPLDTSVSAVRFMLSFSSTSRDTGRRDATHVAMLLLCEVGRAKQGVHGGAGHPGQRGCCVDGDAAARLAQTAVPPPPLLIAPPLRLPLHNHPHKKTFRTLHNRSHTQNPVYFWLQSQQSWWWPALSVLLVKRVAVSQQQLVCDYAHTLMRRRISPPRHSPDSAWPLLSAGRLAERR